MGVLSGREAIEKCVREAVWGTPVLDMHTHIYPAAFGGLLLWGMDDLLTYHYLVSEVVRRTNIDVAELLEMDKCERADFVWRNLYLEHSPLSEACRGPLTCLRMLGLDTPGGDLSGVREYFGQLTATEYVDIVFRLGNIRQVVMTNDPFDDAEERIWLKSGNDDRRFLSALRLDGLLNDWPAAVKRLKQRGYAVKSRIDATTVKSVRRFLKDWVKCMKPVYMAVSLPPEFEYPGGGLRGRLIRDCVLPEAEKAGIPFAMMIGVKKLVNPALGLAGDSVGKSDCGVVERMCREFPENKFLVTMLARENQHELCVTARKFANLLPFGCWWFLNNPSLVEEMTRMRVELLGTSFVPQHSDARVLDQLLYKWSHSREVMARVLTDKYEDLATAGWEVTSEAVVRDVADYLGRNFEQFVKG